MRKKFLRGIVCTFLMILLLLISNVNIDSIYSLPNNFIVGYDEVNSSNLSKKFGAFVNMQVEKAEQDVSTGKDSKGKIVFKLFGIIPIRKIDVNFVPEDDVYVGGVPIGVSILSQGAIVMNENLVITENGKENPQKTTEFKAGDLIYELNGTRINSLEDVENALNDEEVEVKFLRRNKEMRSIVKPVKDVESGKLKLGLLVKDDISGVGTLTYINKNTDEFGALGHAITENENLVPVSEGNIYNCSVVGIDKGKRNEPGKLRCVFLENNSKGIINKNSKYGIFGQMINKDDLVDENLICKLGGRLSVSPGKAYIVSSVSGIREKYEIEIIKANYQKTAGDKSIVFRVKDKRLLDITGGIVQGMSGSPIIQNGKLIGAVTHVFTSDSTKGYGVYIDWMLPENN